MFIAQFFMLLSISCAEDKTTNDNMQARFWSSDTVDHENFFLLLFILPESKTNNKIIVNRFLSISTNSHETDVFY